MSEYRHIISLEVKVVFACCTAVNTVKAVKSIHFIAFVTESYSLPSSVIVDIVLLDGTSKLHIHQNALIHITH